MRLARVVLVAVALGLSGCAAALPRPVPPPAAEPVKGYAVPVTVVPNLGVTFTVTLPGKTVSRFVPAWGITTSTGDGTPVSLQLDASLAQYPNTAKMVCAHEMGHVLGIGAHDPTDPWMRPGMPFDVVLADAPSEAMVIRARARSAGKVYTLAIEEGTEPAYIDALKWGADAWNRVLGRAAIVVRTAPKPSLEPVPECKDGSCRLPGSSK